MTSRVAWFEDDPQAACQTLKSALENGHCAVIPTDTVYGLAAAVESKSGYSEIYKVKGRDFTRPIALIAHHSHGIAQQVGRLLAAYPEEQSLYYAGGLTLVVDPGVATELPGEVSSIQPGTVGIRIPGDERSQSLLAACGGIAWATSFNTSGSGPCAKSDDVLHLLPMVSPAPAAVILSRDHLPGRPSRVAQLTPGGLIPIRQ